jgi:hypothetical protein
VTELALVFPLKLTVTLLLLSKEDDFFTVTLNLSWKLLYTYVNPVKALSSIFLAKYE